MTSRGEVLNPRNRSKTTFLNCQVSIHGVSLQPEMSEHLNKTTSFRSIGDSFPLVDPVNRKLLSLLKDNARLSYADLGKTVHLSPPAVFERVRRLEKIGVIRGHTVVIDPTTIGLSFCAFVRIVTCGEFTCEDIAAVLIKHPEIEECHSIAGEETLIIKTRTPSPSGLDELLRKIRKIPGIVKTLTTVVLQTRFERGIQVPAEPVVEPESAASRLAQPARKTAA